MKKSSFVAMILGTVSGILFAIGMCMALIPEWESFNQGVMFGRYSRFNHFIFMEKNGK